MDPTLCLSRFIYLILVGRPQDIPKSYVKDFVHNIKNFYMVKKIL